MRGILVGTDGSGHSTRAPEWAAREAAVKKVPLTVEVARKGAQVQVDQVLGQLDEASRPVSVASQLTQHARVPVVVIPAEDI